MPTNCFNRLNQDIAIDVVTTDIADLAMMGFGSIDNCRQVCDALSKRYENVSLQIISCQEDLGKLVLRKPDLVFAGIKYLVFSDAPITKCSQDKVWLSEYLDEHGIRFTGSQAAAIKLDFDKNMAKSIIKAHGLNTAASFVAEPGMYSDSNLPIEFPLFVKPQFESDSKGIEQNSFVIDYNSYQNKVMQIFTEFHQPALVESYLSGREFTVAILDGNRVGDISAMPVEIVVDEESQTETILGYSIKKSNKEKITSINELDVCQQISNFASDIYIALGARDFGRIDIKMDKQGHPSFLEANFLPGMNQEWSYFPKACFLNRQLDYDQLVWRMAELALNRD